MADLIAEEDVVVTISHAGYVKRLPVDAYRTQSRGGRGVIGADTKSDDFTEHLFVASTHDDLLCFTNQGRVFKIKVFEIPQSARTSRGRAIVNVIDLRADESVCTFLPVRDFEKFGDFLVFATSNGLVKRTSLKLYQNVRRSGLIAINLKEDDSLVDVRLTSGEDHILLCTASGMAIRFDENDARAMGRSATGVKGISLKGDDKVVAMVRADDTRQLLTMTDNGYGKRTPMAEYLVQPEQGEARPQGRGGKGRVDLKVTSKNGSVVAALSIAENDQMMLITSGGMIVRSRVGEVRQTNRGTQGVRVINPKSGDKLIAAARIADADADTDPKPPTPKPPTRPPPTKATPMPTKSWSDDIYLNELPARPALHDDMSHLHQLQQADPKHIVLDFTQVDAVNSSHLSMLLRLRQVTIQADRKLVCCAVPDQVWSTFLVTGLDKIFHFTEDTGSALATIQIG